MSVLTTNEAIQLAIGELDFQEIINEQVKEQATKAIKEVIRDQFSYNGPLKKQIEEEFSKNNMLDLSKLSILGLANVMSDSIVAATNDLIRGETEEVVQKYLYDALGEFSKSADINEAIETLVNDSLGQDSLEWGDDHRSGSISISLEEEDGGYYSTKPSKYWSIFLEPYEGCNEEEIKLYISEYTGKIYHIHCTETEILEPIRKQIEKVMKFNLDVKISEEQDFSFSNMDI